jgi:hypothetical protein
VLQDRITRSQRAAGKIELSELVAMFRHAYPEGKCPDASFLATRRQLQSTDWVRDLIALEQRHLGDVGRISEAVREALTCLYELLPMLIACYPRLGDWDDDGIDGQKAVPLLLIHLRIRDALNVVPESNLPRKGKAGVWHKSAALIALHAMEAWDSAGNDPNFGVSRSSPVVRFTQAFLAKAGVHQDEGTIAQAFSRGTIAHWAKSPLRRSLMRVMDSV